MTQGRISEPGGSQTHPAERSRTGLAIEQGATLAWLLDNQRHYPADLLLPLCAVALRRQATPELAELISRLDKQLAALAGLQTGVASWVKPSCLLGVDQVRAAQQDIDDTLAAIDNLPRTPQPGDRVLIGTRDSMRSPDVEIPAVVLAPYGYGGVWARSRYSDHARDLGEVTITDVAVYVPVTAAAVDGAA